MKREIKFRANRFGIICDVIEWNFNSEFEDKQDILLHDKDGIELREWRKNLDIMQYTGFKDKHGMEIYEGDIVKTEGSIFQDKNNLEVKFGFYHPFSDEIGYGWYLKGNSESAIVWEEITNLNYLEVIGNIYENPELLK